MLPALALSLFGLTTPVLAVSLFFFSLTPCCSFSLNKFVFDFLFAVLPPLNIAPTDGEDELDLGDPISPGFVLATLAFTVRLPTDGILAFVFLFLCDLFDIKESLERSLSEPAPSRSGVNEPPLFCSPADNFEIAVLHELELESSEKSDEELGSKS